MMMVMMLVMMTVAILMAMIFMVMVMIFDGDDGYAADAGVACDVDHGDI